MFTKQALTLDTQLSPHQFANLLIANAIVQLQQSTHLSADESEQLLSRQFSHMTKQTSLPLIGTLESQFITALFNE